MNKLFDLCQLRDKVKVEERSSPFLEFILFIAMAFQIDTDLVESYFIN